MSTPTREMLAPLCGDVTRPSVANPFAIELDGHAWSVATNGQALLMVLGASDLDPNPVLPTSVIRDETLAKVGPMRALVAFADLATVFRGDTERECPDCVGGLTTCQCCGTPGIGCFTCDAKAVVQVRRVGDMLGAELDAALVWKYLRGVFSPRVRVHPPVGGDRLTLTPLMLAAEDDSWRVLVMPMWQAHEPRTWSFPRGLLDPELANLSRGGQA